jgi:quinolinate synthase
MSKKNTVELEVTADTPMLKTVTVNDVRIMCQGIGDSLSDTYANTGDIKAAAAAISAYSTAISAVKAQLIYKKMTASPARIDFFEVVS